MPNPSCCDASITTRSLWAIMSAASLTWAATSCGTTPERLGDHLGRGKATFERRHGELGATGLELLREAYIQILAGGDGSLIPTNVCE